MQSESTWVGKLCESQDVAYVTYADYPTLVKIKALTPKRASLMSHDESSNTDLIFLYDDGRIPERRLPMLPPETFNVTAPCIHSQPRTARPRWHMHFTPTYNSCSKLNRLCERISATGH